MVRQLDVCPHPMAARRNLVPYLVVLQHDNVLERTDLVVAPLVAPERQLNSRLYPIFEIDGTALMLLTPALGPVARRLLSRPVATVEEHRFRITSALDALFSGS